MYFLRHFKLGFILLLLLQQGCTANYAASEYSKAKQVLRLEDSHLIVRKNQWRLSTDTPVFIAYSAVEQPNYRNKLDLRRPKYQLQTAMEDAFVRRYAKVQASPMPLTYAKALERARASGSRVLIYPQLLEYPKFEDGRPPLAKTHTAEFRVLLVDTLTDKVLDVATISARSELALGNEIDVSDLFAEASRLYVKQLTGA